MNGLWLAAGLIFVVWGGVGLLVCSVVLHAYLTRLARFGFTMIALASWGIAIGAVLFAHGFVAESYELSVSVAFAVCIAFGICCVALSASLETLLMKKQAELMEQIERGDAWLNSLE